MADFDKIKINGVPYNVKDTATAQAVSQVGSDLAKTKETVQQQGQQIAQQGQQIAQQGQQITQQGQQITQQGQQITTNTDAITKLNAGKYYIFQADSYGLDNGWPYILAQIMGLSTSEYTIIVDSGDGFSTQGIPANQFWNSLSGHASDVPDASKVTDIVVCGGRNDFYLNSSAGIQTGIETYITTAKRLFPNAQVHIGFIGWDLNTSEYSADKEVWLSNACSTYISYCQNNGINYLSGVENILHNIAFFQEDGKHPNALGSNYLAGGIYNALIHGYASVSYPFVGIEYTASGIATSIGFAGGELLTDNCVFVYPVQTAGQVTLNGSNVVCDGTRYEIATCITHYFNGCAYEISTMQFPAILAAGSTYYTVQARIIFQNGKVYVSFNEVQNNNYLTVNGATQLQCFQSGPWVMNTMLN